MRSKSSAFGSGGWEDAKPSAACFAAWVGSGSVGRRLADPKKVICIWNGMVGRRLADEKQVICSLFCGVSGIWEDGKASCR